MTSSRASADAPARDRSIQIMALIYPIASLLFLLAVWQGVVTAFEVKPFILPSPARPLPPGWLRPRSPGG